MRRMKWSAFAAAVVTGCSSAGAGGGATDATDAAGGGTSMDASQGRADGGALPSKQCVACSESSPCGDGVCAALSTGDYCVQACPNGDECTEGTTCAEALTMSGARGDFCVPTSTCGGGGGTADGGVVPPGKDASVFEAGPPSSDAAAPSSDASMASSDAATRDAAPDGSTTRDAGADSSSSLPDAAGPAPDAGAPIDGGTLPELIFAVVGDTRPPSQDDVSQYPTKIINRIYADIARFSPAPSFVIGTGDYQYSSPNGNEAAPQFDLYLAARSQFHGEFFPALGNHDCISAVDGNCGPGTANVLPKTYASYLSMLVAPTGQSLPYYSFNVSAADKSWTAKFVFVAANAWTATQSAWLESVLSVPTTYTFVIRHEPAVPSGTASADISPGGPASDLILERYPYTQKITGHVHLYARSGPKEVIFGNGGAPLNNNKGYGFGIVQRRADGAIQFDEYDSDTLLPDLSFRYAVKADGASAP